MNADERGLFSGIVFNHVFLLDCREVSFFEIEVCSGDDLAAVVGAHPVDNLRSVGFEKLAIVSIEWLAIFARKDPNIGELAVADVLQVLRETRKRRRAR